MSKTQQSQVTDIEILSPDVMRREKGLCWTVSLSSRFTPGDSMACPDLSNLVLFENEKPLLSHQLHDDIRNVGLGRFSHWGKTLFFSTTDNSNPQVNKRQYRVELKRRPGAIVSQYVDPPASHVKAEWACEVSWKSFFVNQRGEVRICCNNDVLIGNMNTQDFRDIWSSAQMAHIRSLHLGGDYLNSNCCPSCHVLTNRFPENHAKYGSEFQGYKPEARTGDAWLDSRPASPFQPPATAEENRRISDEEMYLEVCRTVSMPVRALIVPIAKCNLYCPMCGTGVMGKKTPPDVISDSVMDRLLPVYPYLHFLEIVGAGEIFYYPPKNSPMTRLLGDIMTHANPNMGLLLLTNGIAMKKQWADEIIRTDITTILGVSVDTVDPEMYKTVRVGGTIDTLKRNISYMEEMRIKHNRTRPRWRFNIALSTLTARHFDQTLRYIRQYNPEYLFMLPLVDAGYKWFMEDNNLFRPERRSELLEFRSMLDEVDIPSNKDSILQHIDRCLNMAAAA